MISVTAGSSVPATLVAGCGGGNGSTFNGGQPVVTSFPINGGNGVAVTRLSWEAVVASGGLTDLGAAAGVSGSAPDGSAIAARATRDEGLLFDVIIELTWAELDSS